MPVEAINTHSKTNVTPNVKSSQDLTTNSKKVDTEKTNAMKYMIGATALATIIGVGIAGYKWKSGKSVHLKFDKTTVKDYVPNLNVFEKSSKVGATVQETIENVFGKNSDITPHSYDITKEFDSIPIYRNQGGYKDGTATTMGTIQNSVAGCKGGVRASAISHLCTANENGVTHLALEDGTHILSGTVSNYNNKVVQLCVPDVLGTRNKQSNTFIRFAFISPNNEFTPLQKDILKLAEHPEKINNELLRTLTQFKPTNTPDGALIYENIGQYANLDYDLLLSVFQSMANKV